jgi:hypothetical protein
VRNQIQKLSERGIRWLQRSGVVAHFEGIEIADLRNRSPHFRDTVLAALKLIKSTDPRRFARVQRHLKWIVNSTLRVPGLALYRHGTQTCMMDFVEPTPGSDAEYPIVSCASTLVHEATHGVVACRGIAYTKDLRSRIERLCVTEEQRFLIHLTITRPALASSLYHEYDPSRWKEAWAITPFQTFVAVMRRIFFQPG